MKTEDKSKSFKEAMDNVVLSRNKSNGINFFLFKNKDFTHEEFSQYKVIVALEDECNFIKFLSFVNKIYLTRTDDNKRFLITDNEEVGRDFDFIRIEFNQDARFRDITSQLYQKD